MDDSENDVLACMAFPAQHWTKLHPTNPPERRNKGVKRRADVVGIFPSEASIIRLIGALLREANDEWQTQHRYMGVEAMGEMPNPEHANETLQLPPKAAGTVATSSPTAFSTRLTDVTRSPRGKRLVAAVPHRHWKTSTLVAGLRPDGIVAPLVIDHPMNGVTLRACVEQQLAPTLAPGDIVVGDNLRCHKSPGVRAAIEARGGGLRDLPPYSPDLNPIEQVSAKLKNLVRAAALGDIEARWTTIGQSLAAFTPNKCSNDLAHSGYPRRM